MTEHEKPFAFALTTLSHEDGLPTTVAVEADGPWLSDPEIQEATERMLSSSPEQIFVMQVHRSDSRRDDELLAHLIGGQVGNGHRLRVVHLEWNNPGHFYVFVRPDSIIEAPCLINWRG